MEYLPTFARTKSPSDVGKYTIHTDPMGFICKVRLSGTPGISIYLIALTGYFMGHKAAKFTKWFASTSR